MPKTSDSSPKIASQARLRLEDVAAYALGRGPAPRLDRSGELESRIRANRTFLERRIQGGADIYGVTTGFGSSSRNTFSNAHAIELQYNLARYHGCGVGAFLSEEDGAATLAVRLNCLARATSGVSWELLERLEQMLVRRLIPAIPAQGSVGASGDLTPLSYVVSALIGERQVYHRGVLRSAADAWRDEGLPVYALKEREALALMNGTSVMTGIAALAYVEAEVLAQRAAEQTALLVELLNGRTAPFTDAVNLQKPHPGQLEAARRIMALLNDAEHRYHRSKKQAGDAADALRAEIQDSYSLRCAPQVLGVLFDVLSVARGWIETEINSTNDNPVVLDQEDEILNGGLFFGGHIAAACDALKTAVATTVNLLDRQLALMLDRRQAGRLPENLVAERELGDDAPLHHGFKAMQITISALAAECAKQSMPMSVFTRPTESGNQDVVSMGTIAARDLRTINGMAKNAAAIHAMALRQGFYVVKTPGALERLNAPARAALERVAGAFAPMREDRALDVDIMRVVSALFAPAERIAFDLPEIAAKPASIRPPSSFRSPEAVP